MAVGAAKARAGLKYDASYYTPYALESWPDKELRKEYTRLRDIAQKRIKRLRENPNVAETSDIYKEFRAGFPTIRSMQGDRKLLEQALSDVARYIRSEGSTVGGATAAFQRTLGAGGIDVDEIPKDQWTSLGDWWAIVLASGVYYYPSDQPTEYWRQKGGYNVSIDDFAAWQQGEVDYETEWQDGEPGSSSADLRGEFGGGL